jgi:hypothetical protein
MFATFRTLRGITAIGFDLLYSLLAFHGHFLIDLDPSDQPDGRLIPLFGIDNPVIVEQPDIREQQHPMGHMDCFSDRVRHRPDFLVAIEEPPQPFIGASECIL